MIAIVNMSKGPLKDPGCVCPYELRVNDTLIAKFRHKRSDGLAVCLEKAALAARRAETRRISKLARWLEREG